MRILQIGFLIITTFSCAMLAAILFVASIQEGWYTILQFAFGEFVLLTAMYGFVECLKQLNNGNKNNN